MIFQDLTPSKLLIPTLILLLFLMSACGRQDAPSVSAEHDVDWSTASWSTAGIFANDARYPQAGTDRNGNLLVVWAQATGFYANQYHVNSGWGTPVKLSETAPGWSNLRFAVSNSGYAVAAWLHAEQGSMVVKAVRYHPKNGWGKIETLGDNCWLNDLAINDKGAVYLVGDYLTNIPDGWSKGVTLIQYDPQIGWQHNSIGYGSKSTTFDGFPSISVDNWGNGFILWREDGNKIYASRLSHSTLGLPVLLDTGLLTGLWANIKVANNGNVMALWLKNTQIGLITHVYACRYNSESGWGEVEQLDNSVYGAYGQTLTVGTSGTFYAGWTQHAGYYTSATDLNVSTYHPEQGWQLPSIAGSGSYADSLRLAADAHGNLFAAWLQYEPVDQIYGFPYIYTNQSRIDSTWGTPYRLSVAGVDGDGPELVVAPSGRGTIIWSQATGSIEGTVKYDLFFSRFE